MKKYIPHDQKATAVHFFTSNLGLLDFVISLIDSESCFHVSNQFVNWVVVGGFSHTIYIHSILFCHD